MSDLARQCQKESGDFSDSDSIIDTLDSDDETLEEIFEKLAKFRLEKTRENEKPCIQQTAEKDHKDKFNFQNGYDSDDSRVSFWSDEE